MNAASIAAKAVALCVAGASVAYAEDWYGPLRGLVHVHGE